MTSSVFGVEVEMLLFTLSITDLASFESSLTRSGLRRRIYSKLECLPQIPIFVTEVCAWRSMTKLE